jgi:CRISPR-associated protein Csm3
LNESGRTDLPYTEIKTEVSIDRVTSAANPRQMERVPAGSLFGGVKDGQPQPAELVFSIYDGDGCNAEQDVQRLKTVVEGLQLLEDDYLGGLGSRGSGKVRLSNIHLALRPQKAYLASPLDLGGFAALSDLAQGLAGVQKQILKELG